MKMQIMTKKKKTSGSAGTISNLDVRDVNIFLGNRRGCPNCMLYIIKK
jgi:hypothetical protein